MKTTNLKIISTIVWLLIGSFLTIQTIIFLAYLGHDAQATLASNFLFITILLVLLWGWLPNMWTKWLDKFVAWMISLGLLIVALISTLIVVKQSPYFLTLPIKPKVIMVMITCFIFCIKKVLPYLKVMKVN